MLGAWCLVLRAWCDRIPHYAAKVVLIISLWLALGAGPSAACVEGHLGIQQEYTRSVAVLVGTVLFARHERSSDPDREPDKTIYGVRVIETIRGRVTGRIDLFSENSTGRYPMEVGTKYLLFVYREHGQAMVDSCGNSEVFNETSPVLATVRSLKAKSR